MANRTFKTNVVYGDGTPARKEIGEATNQRRAREFAERRFGGECTSANEVY